MVTKRKKIGIFDSGIGGFSILKELLKELPGHEFYYISDKPNAPYGNKSSQFISERCDQLSQVLFEKKVDLILVACNTATAEGIDLLRSNYEIPFVGIEPFVKAVEGIDLSKEEIKPVVITTKAMHDSERFKKLLKKHDPNAIIHPHACENLASLIELAYEKGMASVEEKLESELQPLKNKGYSHVILGCTHYPLVSNKITQFLEAECISPCVSVAKRVAHILNTEAVDSRTELFFKTSDEESFNSLDPKLLSLK